MTGHYYVDCSYCRTSRADTLRVEARRDEYFRQCFKAILHHTSDPGLKLVLKDFYKTWESNRAYVKDFWQAISISVSPRKRGEQPHVRVQNLVPLQLFYLKIRPAWLKRIEHCSNLLKEIESRNIMPANNVDVFARDIDWERRAIFLIEKWHRHCETQILGYANGRFGNSSKVPWGRPDEEVQASDEEIEGLKARFKVLFTKNQGFEEEGYVFGDEAGNYGGLAPNPNIVEVNGEYQMQFDNKNLHIFRQLVTTKHEAFMENI
jgi:hypothetical protein